MNQKIDDALKLLEETLGSDVARLIAASREPPGPKNEFYIQIPSPNDMDLTAEDLGSLVAKTSNAFGRATWQAGRLRAEYKILEFKYKHKLKTSMGVGKSLQEREANAYKAAENEMRSLAVIEAAVELAEAQEVHARVASESARKLFDKVHSMKVAEAREGHGFYGEKDFTSSRW